MTRVLVAGWVGSTNLGDELVFAGLARKLAARGVAVTAVSADAAGTRNTHGVDAVAQTDLRGLVDATAIADAVVFGGGGLLQDETSPLNLPFHLSRLSVARACDTPFAAVGIGVDGLRSRLGRHLVRLGLRDMVACSVRDQRSADILAELGVEQPRVAADLAVGLPAGGLPWGPAASEPDSAGDSDAPAPSTADSAGDSDAPAPSTADPAGDSDAGPHPAADPAAEREPGAPAEPGSAAQTPQPPTGEQLLVSLRPWGGQRGRLPAALRFRRQDPTPQAIVDALAEGLDAAAVRTGLPVRFVAFQADRDEPFHRRVAARMRTEVSFATPGLADLASEFAAGRAVVGMRYHAGIAATLAGLPSVLVGYAPKVEALAGELGAGTRLLAWEPEALRQLPDTLEAVAGHEAAVDEARARLRRRDAGNDIALDTLLDQAVSPVARLRRL